ncbi:hypothetical protein RB195_001237 [Necator americanus]|uniref:Nematode cuticle collagen domain protein n=1 Tax=Necator americanus TaxID=51031 RepID=A0ABR1DE02_NECAM
MGDEYEQLGPGPLDLPPPPGGPPPPPPAFAPPPPSPAFAPPPPPPQGGFSNPIFGHSESEKKKGKKIDERREGWKEESRGGRKADKKSSSSSNASHSKPSSEKRKKYKRGGNLSESEYLAAPQKKGFCSIPCFCCVTFTFIITVAVVFAAVVALHVGGVVDWIPAINETYTEFMLRKEEDNSQ